MRLRNIYTAFFAGFNQIWSDVSLVSEGQKLVIILLIHQYQKTPGPLAG